ncbi:helix-turn-helix domain-containing protein [Ruminococcaceae bacterium OttesenSCG-928-L11]|nr:helix-turn-helix domain-containing protein [Ruminococcaceae bacterium OttesenSCG-928-L11]
MEKPMEKLRKNVFAQYIISYCLILVIPLAVIAVISTGSLRDKQRDSLEIANRSLAQSMGNLEVRFAELENVTMLLSTNSDVEKLLKPGPFNFFSYYSVYQTLSQFRFTNSFIQSAYIVFRDEDMVAGSDGVIANSDFFYRIRYNKSREDYDTWWSGLWTRQHGGSIFRDSIKVNGIYEDTVVYMQSIPMDSRTSGEAVAILFIRQQDLLPLVTHYNDGANSFTLFDPEGREILGATSGMEGIDLIPESERGIVTVEGTAASGRHYRYRFDERYLLSGWYDQLYLTLAFILIACLTGGLLSVVMARRNSTPITNIIRLLDNEIPSGYQNAQKGVFDYLQGTVSSLLYDNTLMRQELVRRLPLLQVTFTERLLGGTLTDYSDIHEQLDSVGIHLNGDMYSVAAFRITGYGETPVTDVDRELTAARIIVEEVIWQYAVRNVWVYSMHDNLVAVIFPITDRRRMADIETICEAAIGHLASANQIHIQVGIGRSYESIADVAISYLQARRALESAAGTQDSGVILYETYLDDRAYFHYPVELELKLIRTTQAGNSRIVEDIFAELHQENIQNGRLSPTMYRYFISELNGTYLKVLSGLRDNNTISTEHLDELISQAPYTEPFLDAFPLIKSLFLEVCSLVKHSKSQKAAQMEARIADYMREHFTDPSLNLARIAHDFGVSEVHMSRLFKDNMKYTFTQYMENLRLEYASHLLSTTATSISDIAEACGYSSHHAFRRAYKRHFGALPSDDRTPKPAPLMPFSGISTAKVPCVRAVPPPPVVRPRRVFPDMLWKILTERRVPRRTICGVLFFFNCPFSNSYRSFILSSDAKTM